MTKLRPLQNGLALVVLFCIAPLLSHANTNLSCRDLTQDTSINVTVIPWTTLSTADFPPELKVNDSFLRFLEDHLPKEQLQSLLRILQVDHRLGNQMPIHLRRSIVFNEKNILEQPPADQLIPGFDTNNISLLRAYTILFALAEASSKSPKDPTVLLSHQEIQTWALMLLPYVPSDFPPTLTVSFRNFFDLMFKRLEIALSQEENRKTLALLLLRNLDIAVSLANIVPTNVIPLKSVQQNPRVETNTTDAARISAIIGKLEKRRPLSTRDIIELRILVHRFFLLCLGEKSIPFVMNPLKSYSFDVPQIRQALVERLRNHVDSNTSLMNAITLFEFLILGTPLPMNYEQFHTEFFKTIETLYLAEPRKIWVQQQSELRTQQQTELQLSQTAKLENLRSQSTEQRASSQPLSAVTLPPPPGPREKVKTRGVARPTQQNTPENSEDDPTKNRIEALINFKEVALHIIAEDTPYLVRFQRLSNQYPKDQTFIFSQEVVDWLVEHPKEAHDFFQAIQLGPVTDSTQSGIKMLSNEDDHPYEVKIQATGRRWRMTLERDGDTWYALRVFHRDKM